MAPVFSFCEESQHLRSHIIEYTMLDLFLLCGSITLRRCMSLCSVREAALATDRFLVKAIFKFDFPPTAAKPRQRPHLNALSEESHRANFAQCFCASVHNDPGTILIVSSMWDGTWEAMKVALQTLPPKVPEKFNHPWVSQTRGMGHISNVHCPLAVCSRAQTARALSGKRGALTAGPQHTRRACPHRLCAARHTWCGWRAVRHAPMP